MFKFDLDVRMSSFRSCRTAAKGAGAIHAAMMDESFDIPSIYTSSESQ